MEGDEMKLLNSKSTETFPFLIVYQRAITPEEMQETRYLVKEWSQCGGYLILPDYIELRYLNETPLPVLGFFPGTDTGTGTKAYKIKDYSNDS